MATQDTADEPVDRDPMGADLQTAADAMPVTTVTTTADVPGPSIWAALGYIERVAVLLANVAVILGVSFAVDQLRLTERSERRQTAIEAVKQTRSPDFLKAYRQLKAASKDTEIVARDQEVLVDSINYVMNVYDAIALYYINDIADRCLIETAVGDGAREMATIASALAYPAALRRNYDTFLGLMTRLPCRDASTATH